PNEQLYQVQHYGVPKFNAADWKLEVGGLARHPRTFTLDEMKARQRKTMHATLECSANSSSPGFMGAIGNVKWTGTPLAPLLKDCGIKARAKEVVFFGGDEKKEAIRKAKNKQNFARSRSMQDAMRDDILLAWEMNGEPLTKG